MRIEDARTVLVLLDDFDTVLADEINARIWFLVGGIYQTGLISAYDDFDAALQHAIDFGNAPKYTTSRDALKSIRLDGWWAQLSFHSSVSLDDISFPDRWSCCLWHENFPFKISRELPTEELAELHAIIQTFIYVWEQCND